ncbi:MAG: bacterial transcriptional activator domain-containing protein, partial [Acidimicrobiales bacterium]|nr:bacterial transcriptional activator domain-containing protein [Acidimicrobiales bacterium]
RRVDSVGVGDLGRGPGSGDVGGGGDGRLDMDGGELSARLDAAERADRAGRLGEAIEEFGEARRLWSGGPASALAAFAPFAERFHPVQDRMAGALGRASELFLSQQRPRDAMVYADACLEIDPCDERGYRVLASACVERGAFDEARGVLTRARGRLLEAGLTPSPELEVLEAIVVARRSP